MGDAPSTTDTGPEPAAKPTILCVDDDRVVLTLVRSQLLRAGYEVVIAASGEQALAAVEEVKPDLILLDVMMEGLDGYETCARLQRIPELSYTPVIFATAREGEEDRSRAFAVGAVDYLVKPIRSATLLEKVSRHLATQASWQALRSQAPSTSWGFSVQDFSRFKEYLGRLGTLTPQQHGQLQALRPQQAYAAAGILGISEDRVAQHIAQVLRLPYVSTLDPSHVALGVLPPPFCRANLVVGFEVEQGGHAFVLSNPFNLELIQLLQQWKGKSERLRLSVTEPSRLLALFDEAQDPGAVAAEQAEAATPAVDVQSLGGIDEEDAQVSEDSAPIVRLANQIIENAYAMRASDIHVEPEEREVVIRYRIDGALRVINRFPGRALMRPLASRLKVMSSLDIVERRLPQDGRLIFKRYSQKGSDFDLRVATAPMQFGEKIVMRILDKRKAVLPLPDLGFSKRNLDRYRQRLDSPDGMILHVGPTGSGKSMTLYAALNEIKRPELNVQTAEDPIEYTLPGINQLQVHPDIGLTFARALRSFLRLDPDVILVGEIRDGETAQIGIEAALTGHLVLSTLHTKDATSTAVRLVEMGIEPFLVASSLLMVCAQRLLRRLCSHCKEPYEATAEERRLVGLPADRPCTLYRPRGCPACMQVGFRGRVGAHELLIADDALRRAITRPGLSGESLKRLAVREGDTTTLYWDAMEKVRAGLCGLADVLGEVRADEFDTRPAWMFEELDLPPRDAREEAARFD